MKKSIKTVWIRESEELEEVVPMKLKKKAGKYTVRETEALSKTNNALLKVVVEAHLWKQLEEGKHASVTDLSNKINISMRYVQPIIRLYDLAPTVKDDKFDRGQPSRLRLADLREIPMLWREKLEKF